MTPTTQPLDSSNITVLQPRMVGNLVSRPSSGSALIDQQPQLGDILVEMGAISATELAQAQILQTRQDVRLGRVLLAHEMISEAALLLALSQQQKTRIVDPMQDPADPRLIDLLGADRCLRETVLPWRCAGQVTVIVVAWPEDFHRLQPELQAIFGPVVMALAAEAKVQAAILVRRRTELGRRAETRTTESESCRNWPAARVRGGVALTCLLAGVMAAFAPLLLVGVLTLWTVLTLLATTLLKAAAMVLHLRQRTGDDTSPKALPEVARQPTISILVPLFNEADIAPRLVARLSRLSYPRELLDILLIVEEDDATTRRALGEAELPLWMRIVVVPAAGQLRTKPRALNFALDFARGSIVGVYDAEDAPEPVQLQRVVERFHQRGSELACVQGVLDFYNPRTNWLSRCFTIEYATWFRIVLPGLERLKLPVPLGGTTLFFRRNVLEELGGWDAHNVTEDADLGIRLARHGYRTELLPTVTEEEANCRALPWVRQRSRWLKGYAMTYAVHMRNPRLLLRQLGWWRFAGVQILFGGTLTQYLMAPLLWSFWLVALGVWHPLNGLVPPAAFWLIGGLFVASEAVNLALGWVATAEPRHRFLRIWLPTLHLYFPLGALAAYKGAWEMLTNPFYWDKTTHGVFDRTSPAAQSGDQPLG